MTRPPIVNTHVHLPPNFSAFTTVADAIQTALAEGVRAIGISNFYDQQVYRQFADQAAEAGIVALYGLEFITVVADLEASGTRINDPANPGRMYVCGKGIDPFRERSAEAAATAAEIRQGNDARAQQMLAKLSSHFQAAGLPIGLDAAEVIQAVATRGEVPTAWVSLQERHIAQAVEEAISVLPKQQRASLLERAYGAPATANLEDPAAMQAEIRSRLLKTGRPGFAPEVPLTFETAYRYVLDMGRIPCYPTLADGADPVCPFEEPPAELAQRLRERGIALAELIPIRNRSAVVDQYVRAFAEAGIEVVAGTEHNTVDRIAYDPSCIDGPISAASRQACYEGTCIIAAHQARVATGQPGFVDSSGARAADRDQLVAEGRAIIEGAA